MLKFLAEINCSLHAMVISWNSFYKIIEHC